MVDKRPKLMPSLIILAVLIAAIGFGIGKVDAVPEEADGSIPLPAELPSEATVQRPQPAFTLATSRTLTKPDGQVLRLSSIQFFQRADGISKSVQTQYRSDGGTQRVQTLFSYGGVGTFQVDESRRRLVFSWLQVDDTPADVERFLREHPLFSREEAVLGVNTMVWRIAGPGESEFKEEYRAPSLGGRIIKTVKVSSRGRETLEPTSIEMGEPSQSLFAELFSLPVDYSNFERQVREADDRNAREVADLMRQSLARMRELRP